MDAVELGLVAAYPCVVLGGAILFLRDGYVDGIGVSYGDDLPADEGVSYGDGDGVAQGVDTCHYAFGVAAGGGGAPHKVCHCYAY